MNKTYYMRARNKQKFFRAVAGDKRLSATAIGIMCRLINNDNSWVIYKKTLPQDLHLTKGRFDNAWEELIDCGYIEEKVVITPKGRIYEYTIVEDPDMILELKPNSGDFNY